MIIKLLQIIGLAAFLVSNLGYASKEELWNL
jgi:hypothetical protein